jgi:RNA polymerase sigma-70 factor (ECF subfamily)
VSPSREPERSDASLVAAARDGQVRALEQLLERHERKVLRVLGLLGVPAQDREDVAQEVFIRVFRHLKGFRVGQEFGAWLYRVTVNAAHDYRSRRRRLARGEAPLEEPEQRIDPDARADAPAEQGELRQALERALETLTERERTIFVLREIEGLGSREVARALGITSITVRRHLSLARRRLRKALASEAEAAAFPMDGVAPDGSGNP